MSERNNKENAEEVIPTICSNDCGGQCMLKVHVRDGVITRIETDDAEDIQYRACMKGRARRQLVYAPDRLKYPMRRTGERGEGKFERISWDDALDTVAGELKRVKEAYGPSAILFLVGGGDLDLLHHFNEIFNFRIIYYTNTRSCGYRCINKRMKPHPNQ